MGLKGTKLASVLGISCPRCQETKLFEDSNPYNFSKIFDMPERCKACGQNFEVEPGFYYGAMYVSYGLSIAYLVSVFVAFVVLYPDFTITEYLVTAITSLVILTPPFFRISRAIWINFFVSFDPHAVEAYQQELKKEENTRNEKGAE